MARPPVEPHGRYAVIGGRIRSLREMHQLTQGALGKKVHASQPTVSQWELGIKLPSRASQFALADALRTERSILFAELLGRNEAAA